MSLTKRQKDMLHFIKCKYLSSELTHYAGSLYPKEMEADKFSYGNVENRIKFLVYYSPLRSSQSRIRAWKTLVALQDKRYIVGFYINQNRHLRKLTSGVNDASSWSYWSKLKNRAGQGDEIDSGEIIVYLTPKGLKANTEINEWSGTAHIQSRIVDLLKKDGKLSPPTKFDEEGKGKNPHLVDDLTRLVHADSEKDWIPLMEDWGIINKSDLIQLSILEAKLGIELKIERKKRWDERYKRS